jgi:hypothetical protein
MIVESRAVPVENKEGCKVPNNAVVATLIPVITPPVLARAVTGIVLFPKADGNSVPIMLLAGILKRPDAGPIKEPPPWMRIPDVVEISSE